MMEDNSLTDEDIEIGRRTWKRAAMPIQQDAFREGYDVGRQSSFQQGFDQGYQRGFSRGHTMGFINGVLRAADDVGDSPLEKLKLSSYETPHRGCCVMCPSNAESVTKEKMVEVSSRFSTLSEVFELENSFVDSEDVVSSVKALLAEAMKSTA